MRKLIGALSLTVSVAVTAPVAAQVPGMPGRPFHLGAQGNLILDGTTFGVGARYENDLNTLLNVPGLRAVASFDLYFPDTGSLWEINAGAAYGFNLPGAPVKPYAGGGISYQHNGGGSSGLNVFGGVKLQSVGTLTPYVELRFPIRDGSSLVLTAGVMII